MNHERSENGPGSDEAKPKPGYGKPGRGLQRPDLINTPDEWHAMLGREPEADEAKWLRTFRVSHSGNISRIGYLTDPRTQLSLPFRLNVYFVDSTSSPEGKPWTWAVALNPVSNNRISTINDKGQSYSNEYYTNPYEAALSARLELQRGGFEVSNEPHVIASLRAQFQEAAREQTTKEQTK